MHEIVILPIVKPGLDPEVCSSATDKAHEVPCSNNTVLNVKDCAVADLIPIDIQTVWKHKQGYAIIIPVAQVFYRSSGNQGEV